MPPPRIILRVKIMILTSGLCRIKPMSRSFDLIHPCYSTRVPSVKHGMPQRGGLASLNSVRAGGTKNKYGKYLQGNGAGVRRRTAVGVSGSLVFPREPAVREKMERAGSSCCRTV